KPRRKTLQIFRLRLADDLDAPRLDVFVIAGEREAGLLDTWAQDDAVEPVVAGDELQREVLELARQQRTDVRLNEIFLALLGHEDSLRVLSGAPLSSAATRAG